MKPHRAVTKDTIARWIKTVMARSGINVRKYGAHTIRAAATSKAGSQGVPIQDILKTAGWSNAGTFQKFYHKSKDSECSFSKAVLQL